MKRALALSAALASVAAFVALPTAATAVPAAVSASQAGTYHELPQTRAFDSRSGLGGVPKRAVPAHATVTVPIAGRDAVPAAVSAVAITITVVTPAHSGSLTVYPGGGRAPAGGSVSFTANRTQQSTVTAVLGASGALSIRNNGAGAVQIVGDLSGYYLAGTPTSAGAFGAVPVFRLLDTRAAGAVPAHGVRTFRATGVAGIPASGVGAVAVDVGVLVPAVTGSITLTPGGAVRSSVPGISFARGQTVQSELTQSVGASGTISIGNNTARAVNVIVDVTGYYRGGTAAVSGAFGAANVGVLDTRRPQPYSSGPVPAGRAVQVPVLASLYPGSNLLPESGVAAVSVNITVLHPTRAGSLTVYAGGAARASASALTYAAGASSSGTVRVPLGANGAFTIADNGSSPVTVVAVVTGYWVGQPFPLSFGAPSEIDPEHTFVTEVSCPSATYCAAVEYGGYVLTKSGKTWSGPRQITAGDPLISIDCTSTSFCMAAGHVATFFDGMTWSAPATVDTGALLRIGCASPTFCVGVDHLGSYFTFDGSSWTAGGTVAGAPEFDTISCPSATFCVAGDASGNPWTFDGRTWTAPAILAVTKDFSRLSCPSVTFCALTGPGGKASIFDGATWSAPVAVTGGAALNTVSCASASFCLAVDSADYGWVYDGLSWHVTAQVEAGSPTPLRSVACSAATQCTAFGQDADPRPFRFDGSAWTHVAALDNSNDELVGVSCTSATFCVAVDGGHTALRFDGHDWAPLQVELPEQHLTDVSCAGQFCAAVDDRGTAITYAGGRWTTPARIDGYRQFSQVSCASALRCMAIDNDHGVETWNGHTWGRTQFGSDYGPLVAVSCAGALCAVADLNGGVYLSRGTAWSARTSTAVRDPASLTCTSATNCLLGGKPGLMAIGSALYQDPIADFVRYDGKAWHTVGADASESFSVLSCASATRCVGVSGDRLIAFDGHTWSAPSGFLRPTSVSCGTPQFCVAVDNGGNATVLTSG